MAVTEILEKVSAEFSSPAVRNLIAAEYSAASSGADASDQSAPQ
jgi:hypothetical protein